MTQTATEAMLSFEDIKKMFPDEWVVLGDPIFDGFKILAGVVVAHGKDKRQVALTARNLVSQFKTTNFSFTGTAPKNQGFLIASQVFDN